MADNIIIKYEWYDMIKVLPDEIKGEILFAFIQYISEGVESEFKDSDKRLMFNVLKSQHDNIKKVSDKDYFYIIQCYNEDENFYKIGTTNHENIEDRFSFYKNTMPYEYEVIYRIKKGKKINPVKLEKLIKKELKNKKYKPKIKFGGYTECFELDAFNDIANLINN